MKLVVLAIDTDRLTTAEARTAFLGQMSTATKWGRNQHDTHGWCLEERTLDIVDVRVVDEIPSTTRIQAILRRVKRAL